jgi:hypothetical protein
LNSSTEKPEHQPIIGGYAMTKIIFEVTEDEAVRQKTLDLDR